MRLFVWLTCYGISLCIHWILLCEYEIIMNQSVWPKGKQKSRRKNGVKRNVVGKGGELISTNQIFSVLCSVCQGNGVHNEGDKLEEVTITLSQVCILWKLLFSHFSLQVLMLFWWGFFFSGITNIMS